MKKPGDSTVQTNAEKPLLEEEGFSNNYCDLIKNLIKLTKTQPDCVDESKRAVIEIYARTTAANSGAKQKIAKDILKLIFLKSKLEKFGFNKFEIWLSYD